MDEAKVRAHLHENSEEFRRLEEKHHQYDEQLDAIADLAFLSPEDQIRKIELKKRKLRLKDRMYELMLDFHREQQEKKVNADT